MPTASRRCTPAWTGRRGRAPRDAYAAEHPAEFFAVLSEAFFENPAAVLAEYGEIYRQLAAFYRQDPAARLEAKV